MSAFSMTFMYLALFLRSKRNHFSRIKSFRPNADLVDLWRCYHEQTIFSGSTDCVQAIDRMGLYFPLFVLYPPVSQECMLHPAVSAYLDLTYLIRRQGWLFQLDCLFKFKFRARISGSWNQGHIEVNCHFAFVVNPREYLEKNQQQKIENWMAA